MKISELYSNDKTVMSFEVFPPKKEIILKEVDALIGDLAALDPGFISVTCGAGGSANRNKTVELAAMIKKQYGVESMAHMICISSTRENIQSELEEIRENGIENVLALRGDIPSDGFDPSHCEYRYAKDLIGDIKTGGGLCIAAAAYPEGHIECEDFGQSVDHLKQKEEAGAELFVSQLFFNNAYFYNLIGKARQSGVKGPITAGIMPMLGKAQISKMIFMCGASLPSKMIKLLSKYESDEESLLKAGLEYAGEQIADLARNGVDGIHIYTMNKPYIAKTLKGYMT